MSSKNRKHNSSRQFGFLRPTVASQGRCNKQCSRTLPVPGQKSKKKIVKKKTKLYSSSSNPTLSTNATRQNVRCIIPSAVEVYTGGTRSESVPKTHSSIGLESTEHSSVKEARKMCEELKEQINDLKLHQEAYEKRFRTTKSRKSNGHNMEHPKIDESCTNIGTSGTRTANSSENLMVKNLHISPSFNEPSNPVIRVNVNKKEKPFQDTSNLPTEQLSYNSLFFRPDASELIIKNLNSERDRYKRKVMKLRQELKSMKQEKTSMLKSPEISLHDLSFFNADMIGEGRLAVVYEGTLNGRRVAVKKLVRSGVMTSSDRSYLVAEAGLLLPLQHRNVVRIFGVCSTPMEPLIVTEFVNGKTLAHLLQKSRGGLDPATFFSISRDVAIGLAYLHSQKPPVLHLNLRPSNILIDSFLIAKVADFGFSKIRIDAGVSNCSNLAYLAPELLKYPAQITIKTDVYAYAILLWHMTTGKDPMANRTTSQSVGGYIDTIKVQNKSTDLRKLIVNQMTPSIRILDMLEHDQRLCIRTDLPLSIQQVISSCWDSAPGQRPTFKDIIIEFETMILPDEWAVKLKEIGISRTDTSDMHSNARDTASLASSTTTSSNSRDEVQEHADFASNRYTNGTKKKSKSPERRAHLRSSQETIPLRRTDKLRDDVAFRNRDYRVCIHERVKRESPIPLSDVRYVAHNLQNHISTPEIVPHKPRSSWEERHQKLRFSEPRCSREEERRTNHSPCQVWSNEPVPEDIRPSETSKFDSKFRDYVSDACQAESTHKVHTSHRNWPSLPTSYTQKTKSLLSSEYIQVHSVGTPSTMASISKSSSLDTAVYLPEPYNHHNGTNGARTSYLSDSLRLSAAQNERNIDSKLESSINRGNFVLNNAKRLLSSSPLHSYTKPVSTLSSHLSSRPLPEYKPKYVDHKRLALEHGYVRSESSKSDMSVESFLPLPPKLHNHQCLPLNENPTHKSDLLAPRAPDQTSHRGSRTTEMSVEINGQAHEDQDFDEKKSEKVSRILTRTAEELHNASSMLYSASAELRKKKLNDTL